MSTEEPKDKYNTIKGRPIIKGRCPNCSLSFATTPKLATRIMERGCYKCNKGLMKDEWRRTEAR